MTDEITEQARQAWLERNQIRLKAIANGPMGYQFQLIDMDSGKSIPVEKITITVDTMHGLAKATVDLILFAVDASLYEVKNDATD